MSLNKKRSSIPQFSYRQSLKKEDRKMYRRIALIITAFFGILLVIWFMGTSFLNTLSYLSRGNDSSTNSSSNNSDLPLLTPTLDKLPESINTESITVSGQTTSEVEVTLFVNTKEIIKTSSDTSGLFKFEKVTLTNGLNLIKIVARNSSGEEQEASTTITLDKVKPPLTLKGPVDGATFPADTKTVNVNGTTEPDAILHVSGNQAIVETSGNFSYNLPVSPGNNNIEINSIDSAGNTTVVKLTIIVEASAPVEETQP